MSQKEIPVIKNPKFGICYIAPDVAIPGPRGSSVHVLELSRNLQALGCRVHIICRRLDKESLALEKFDNITVHRLYRWIVRPEKETKLLSDGPNVPKSRFLSWSYYLYLITLFRLYVGLVASIIVIRNKLGYIIERETSFGAGSLSSLVTRKPMVLEIIGPRYSRMSAWRSKKILYYTKSMLRRWVDKNKCVPIYAGVDLSLFHQDEQIGRTLRSRIGVKEDVFLVGYVGTFQNWHGVDILLSSLSILRKKHNDVCCLMVGPGFKNYENIAKGLEIRESCYFVGPVEYHEVANFVNCCDVMVAPYNPSVDPLRNQFGIGWPIKILEYMACGKPVISTNVDPINTFVIDRSTGLLVTPGSTVELTSALEYLYTNRLISKMLAEKAKAMIVSNYSWRSVAEFVLKTLQ